MRAYNEGNALRAILKGGGYPMEQGLVFFLQSAWIEPGVSLVIEGRVG